MIKPRGAEREIFIMERESNFVLVMIGKEEQHTFFQKYASYELARIQANAICKLMDADFVERG